jgi:hypothetical protein
MMLLNPVMIGFPVKSNFHPLDEKLNLMSPEADRFYRDLRLRTCGLRREGGGLNVGIKSVKPFFRHLTGGLDLAAEAAGIRTVAMCEKDEFCRKVLKQHWPDVPIYEDIRNITGEEVLSYEKATTVSSIDVIHGGFP